MSTFGVYFDGISGCNTQKRGGWSTSPGIDPKFKLFWLVYYLDEHLQLVKFHQNRRGSMCHAYLVLSWTHSEMFIILMD